MTGFEPAASTTPLWRATKLRYIPEPFLPAGKADRGPLLSRNFPKAQLAATQKIPHRSQAPVAIWQARMVLRINMAMVMTPTPPGTGVMAVHFGATASKSTSPTSR